MKKRYIAYALIPLFFFSFVASFEPLPEDQTQIEAILKPAKQTFVQAVFGLVPYTSKHQSIITNNEWQELDLDTLLKNADRTTTSFGLWGLRQLLHPIADQQEIINRQTFIQKIVQDDMLRAKIQDILNEIELYEDDINAYWNIHDELHNNASTLYYSMCQPYTESMDATLNHSKYALESAALVELTKNIAGLAINLGMAGITTEAINSVALNRPFNLKQAMFNGLQRPMRNNSFYPIVFKGGYASDKCVEALSQGTAGDYYLYYGSYSDGHLKKTLGVCGAGLHMLAVDLIWAAQLRETFKHLRLQYKIQSALQGRMMRIARLFTLIKELRLLLHDIPMFDVTLVNSLDVTRASTQAQQLSDLFLLPTFDGEHTYFYSRGNVLLAHQLLCDVKQQLIPVLQSVAIVDGYVSIAKFYRECIDKNMPCSFVQLNADAQPKLYIENAWTPLMPMQQAVSNSIVWNSQTKNKIVLTGPNGCGKSTIMKAAAHAIIMGQSWGLIMAHNGTMSIFAGLRTSLMPRESLQDNLSTFMAEKKRIDGINNFIKSHQQDCVCVMLDEPYKGTVESEAAHRLHQFGHSLASADHCMLVMATHLEKPIMLEQETGVFANYQMGLDQTADGKFVRTFKLLPGAALWWFHDMERRARFIDQLLQPMNV